jgi:hypothetical protein
MADQDKRANVLEVLGEYFKSVAGLLSLLPGILATIDTATGFLQISTALKPFVYWLIIPLVVYAMWREAAHYVSVHADSPQVGKMLTRARNAIIGAIALTVIYWIAVTTSVEWLPGSLLGRQVCLAVLGIMVALIFERLTTCLMIFGLRSFVYRHRQKPVPNVQPHTTHSV